MRARANIQHTSSLVHCHSASRHTSRSCSGDTSRRLTAHTALARGQGASRASGGAGDGDGGKPASTFSSLTRSRMALAWRRGEYPQRSASRTTRHGTLGITRECGRGRDQLLDGVGLAETQLFQAAFKQPSSSLQADFTHLSSS
jgi:hypothetical protein